MALIRIVLVEPQRISMQGALAELEEADDIEVVGHATTGRDGMDQIYEKDPDVALIAIQLPDMSGLVVLDEIADRLPIIVLTSQESRDVTWEAMRLGARGYLLKWNTEIKIAQAIRDVANGKPVLGATSLNTLLAALRERDEGGRKRHDPLTERERDVLTLMSHGKNQIQVAETLRLSHSTIRTHCRNAYTKLGVRNQAAAIREAVRRGLISDRDPVTDGHGHRGGSRTSRSNRGARGRPS